MCEICSVGFVIFISSQIKINRIHRFLFSIRLHSCPSQFLYDFGTSESTLLSNIIMCTSKFTANTQDPKWPWHMQAATVAARVYARFMKVNLFNPFSLSNFD